MDNAQLNPAPRSPTKITLGNLRLFQQRGVDIPAYIPAVGSMRFRPEDFAIGGPGTYLKQKIIDSQFQTLGLEAFLRNPAKACTYAVGTEPDDTAAKFFAAYLLQEYLTRVGNTSAIWHGLHDPRALVKNEVPCSFLVLTGLTPETTPYRLEKARDLIEYYHNIPKIVVIGGIDPITFFYTKLRLRPTHFFYQGKGVNRSVEVV